jgi:hypothetical protein
MSSRLNPNHLSSVTIQSNPFLGTRHEIETYVLTQPPGTACPYQNSSINILIVHRQDGGLDTIDISNIPKIKFISALNHDDLTSGIIGRLTKFDQTRLFESYHIKTGELGSIINLDIDPRTPLNTLYCCITEKIGGDYFDLELLVLNEDNKIIGILSYKNRKLNGCTHSGDIGALYHGISIDEYNPKYKYVIAVCGYSKKLLSTFTNQVPAVCIISKTTETIIVVPLNLAEAVCGNATLAIIGVIMNEQFVTLTRQSNVANINTGYINASLQHAAEESIRNSMDIIAASVSVRPAVTYGGAAASDTSDLAESHTSVTEVTEVKVDLPNSRIVIFVEDEILDISDIFSIGDTTYVSFGEVLRIFTTKEKFKDRKLEKLTTRLPLLGTVYGPAAALVRTPEVDGITTTIEKEFNKMINSSPLPIFIVSDKWLRSICQYLCTAIFILIPSIKGSVSYIMDNINRDALCMASPYSIVLVFIDGEYYWYRGVSWDGLVDIVPKFGENVSELFTSEKINNWVSIGGISRILKMPVLVPATFNSVIYEDKLLTIQAAFDIVNSLTIEELSDPKTLFDIQNMLTQISCILPPGELSKITVIIATKLKEKIDSCHKEELTTIYMRIFEGTLSQEELQILNNRKSQIVGLKRKLARDISSLIEMISNLASQRASSSRKTDLQRIIHIAKVKQNVSDFNKMTFEQMLKIVEGEDSEKRRYIIFLINSNANAAIAAIDKSLFAYINSNPESFLLPSTRCIELDGETTVYLVGQSGHQYEGDKCLTFPQSHSGEGRRRSSLPIVMLKCLFGIKDPNINWLELTNGETAFWRLLFRNFIRNNNQTRDYGINPASGDLTLFVGYMFLLAAVSLCPKSVSSSEESVVVDSDATIPESIRSLIGFAITTLSSGQTPKTDIFTFFGSNPKLLKENESWIMMMFVPLLKFTGWNLSSIRFNIGTYLVKLLRNILTDPLTDNLRKLVKKISLDKQTESIQSRNEELRFARLAGAVLFAAKDDKDVRSIFREIAQRLLEFKPAVSKQKNIKSFIKFFETMSGISIGDDLLEDKRFIHILAIACNIHTKRSGLFAVQKKEILEQFKSGTLVPGSDMSPVITELTTPLQKYTSDGEVHIQNLSAFEGLDLQKMKGDAEYKRTPYSITVQEDLEKEDAEFKSKLNYVLGIKSSEESIVTVSVSGEGAACEELVSQVVHPIIKLFETHGGAVYDFAKSFYLGDLNLPASIDVICTFNNISPTYKELLSVLIKESNIDIIKLRDIIGILLANWQDNVNGESKAIEFLR